MVLFVRVIENNLDPNTNLYIFDEMLQMKKMFWKKVNFDVSNSPCHII